MSNDFRKLAEKRQRWVEANRENGFEEGVKRLLTDLYPDNAHFIYELLQNAEDPKATEVRFTLTDNSVEFEHNGKRVFSYKDVDSITSIGTSTKRDDPTSIGKFGVGFKAVFAYTNTPEIHSGEFDFRIRDLVVPEKIGDVPQGIGTAKTRFVFPFNHPAKHPKQAVEEIERALRSLGDNTLLFLNHICKIEYLLPDGAHGYLERIEQDNGRIEIHARNSDGTETKSHWLRFQSEEVEVPDEVKFKQCKVTIAYKLKEVTDGQTKKISWKIEPLNPGQVSIYFPAEKETSNLRFHIHAPFASTVARDSVRDDCANDILFQQLAMLAAASLHQIRDLGLLTADFLSVLPNPQDTIPARYDCIRKAIIDEMNEQPLTPTHTKSHAPAKHLLQAKASLKGLLSTDDLEFLVDNYDEPPQWAISAPQRNSNADRFLTGLEITDWDVDELINLLTDKADASCEPDEDFTAWLAGKSLEWHQQFYALLYKEHQPNESLFSLLYNSKIVRLSDGGYGAGYKSYFPSDVIEHDEALPRVDINVYTSGKSKGLQESAKNFLVEIGVREVGEAEQVEAILEKWYMGGERFKPRKNHLKRFISLIEKDPDKYYLFSDYFIFERKDGKWGKPSQVFLDQPFKDTGLSAYYDVFVEKAECCALADSYKDCGITIKSLVKFAEAVGVRTRLEITKTDCRANPDWWDNLRHVYGKKSSPIDKDYVIKELGDLLERPSLKLSKLVWNTMHSLPSDPDYLHAIYQHNRSEGRLQADSQLVHQLRKFAWIPQGDSTFVCPAEASRDLLPEGFPFDPGWRWLKAIHFGEEAVKKSEAYRQKQSNAKELGFDSPEQAAEARELMKAVKASGKSPTEVIEQLKPTQHIYQPEQSVPDPDRRRKNILANTADAPNKETVQRERSVQVGTSEISDQAKTYLRIKYKNSERQLICQCCHMEMPFKLRSGEHYFEAVQCVEDKDKRHFQNRLALCPTCAAMYQHARETDDAEICRRIIELDADDQPPAAEISIRLAGREHTLRFVGTHWFDLKTILQNK